MIDVTEALVNFFRAKLVTAEVGYDLTRVFPDHPRNSLKDASFPRMHLIFIGGTNEAKQLGNTTEEQTFRIQANIYTRNKKKVSIGGIVHEGAKLNKRIMTDAIRVLRQFQSDALLCDAGLYAPNVEGVFTNFPVQDNTQQVAFEFTIKRTVI